MLTTTNTVAEEQAITLDDLVHFDLGGAYCFVGNLPDICRKVESLGIQFYYVMATEKYYAPTANGGVSAAPSYRPQVFKVVNNIIGRSIAATNDIIFDSLEQQAWFTLPKIPWVLLDQVDVFFRKVYLEHGTESIVILTYDPDIGDSEGWGFIVPEQENTSVDCDYKPESVAGEKPDHVYQVGSIHSHPQMTAFASGTDHKDQADFDGIHITYGWRSSVNQGATEYYAELQLAGTNFTVDVDDIFEDRPKADVEVPDLDDWMSKVSKKAWSGGYSTGGGGSTYKRTSNTELSDKVKEAYARIKHLPTSAPDVQKNYIIGVLHEGDTECPFCHAILVDADVDRRRCMDCHQYLAKMGENVVDIVKIRKEASTYTQDIDIVDHTPIKPIYIWYRLNNGDNQFDLIHSPATSQGK